MIANVYVTLKRGVHDPQGEAVQKTLESMGHKEIHGVRIGKYIELKLSDMPKAEAEAKLIEICEKLLANTVIEGYRVEMP